MSISLLLAAASPTCLITVDSKEALEEPGSRIGQAGDLVGGLAIELVVDFRRGAGVEMFAERPQFGAAKGPDGGTVALRRQPDATASAAHRLGHDAPCIEAVSAIVLIGEHEDLIAWADVLAAPHGLLVEFQPVGALGPRRRLHGEIGHRVLSLFRQS